MKVIVNIDYLPESANAGRLEALSGELGHPTPESLSDVLTRVTRRIEHAQSAGADRKQYFTVIVEFCLAGRVDTHG